jgi:hypothetical protein
MILGDREALHPSMFRRGLRAFEDSASTDAAPAAA